MGLSPLIGMLVGALVTLVLIVLVLVVRARRERAAAKPRHQKPAELSELPVQQYPLQNLTRTEAIETDPDVIPNKFGKLHCD
jgi:hypothetical protein